MPNQLHSRPVKAGKRILIVDDVEDVRTLVRAILLRSMPSVCIDEAESGVVASVKLKMGCFDAVISDVQMPNGTGLWLHYFMQEYHPQTPLLLFTSNPSAVSIVAKEPLRAVISKDDIQSLIMEIERIG